MLLVCLVPVHGNMLAGAAVLRGVFSVSLSLFIFVKIGACTCRMVQSGLHYYPCLDGCVCFGSLCLVCLSVSLPACFLILVVSSFGCLFFIVSGFAFDRRSNQNYHQAVRAAHCSLRGWSCGHASAKRGFHPTSSKAHPRPQGDVTFSAVLPPVA